MPKNPDSVSARAFNLRILLTEVLEFFRRNFVVTNDGSIIHNIQIVADVARFDDSLLKKITTGSCIKVEGRLVEGYQGYKVGRKLRVKLVGVNVNRGFIDFVRQD